MTAEDVEQQIRRHPTANERFLLGLLDEARAKTAGSDKQACKGGWINQAHLDDCPAPHGRWES